jgi:hypothetical protein
MRPFPAVACRPRGDLRAAGVGYLASAAAFLAVAWLGDQRAFTGVGFAFLGLGIAFIARGRRGR